MPVRSVALVLLCAVVVVAGCAGVQGPSTPTAPAPTTPTPTASTPSEPTATPLPFATQEPYAAELEIENPSRQSVTVKAYEQPADDAPAAAADTLVVNRTTDEYRIDVDSAFEPETDYRVVVTVDGTTRWNDTVNDYEIYTLSVERNGTVRVASFAVR